MTRSASASATNVCALCAAIEVEVPAMDSASGETVVLRDFAPLVPGHALVVTRRHYLAIGAVDHVEVLQAVIEDLQGVRATIAGEGGTVVFEHGPRRRGSAGSCIDHAHIHVLPVPAEVRSAHLVASPTLRECGIREWRLLGSPHRLVQLHQHSSYLWVQDSGGINYVTAVRDERLPSQLLRRWAAEVLNVDAWDWRARRVYEQSDSAT